LRLNGSRWSYLQTASEDEGKYKSKQKPIKSKHSYTLKEPSQSRVTMVVC